MLSVTGKLTTLFAQVIQNEVVKGTVNDIEDLGSNLSRNIWQKIILIQVTPTFISICIYSSTNVAASNAATLVLHCECCIVLQRRDCSYCQ